MAELWRNLAPHNNVFVLNEPNQVSDNISIPKTTIATISNWLQSSKGYVFTPEQQARFDALPSM